MGRSWGLSIAVAGYSPRIGIHRHIDLDPVLFCGGVGVQGKVRVGGDMIVSKRSQVLRILVVWKH